MQDSLGEKQVALDATIAKLMSLVNDQAKENEARLKSLADTQNSLSAGQKAAEEQAKRQLELQQAAAREKEKEKNAAAMGQVVTTQLNSIVSEAMDECIGKEKKKKGSWF
uniref:Uncharacterized protein n=1 Tax=Strombidinopsis acuminata TaxID=141414 RepID=A0A7S3RUN6_9SPIT|mmetsp:Transcript_1238/g.1536  ORF Transcript_1238/g.1536 Transcript_1238/m.1536 type:complete len:110 (+) Transcript_1238:5818-6147(+)